MHKLTTRPLAILAVIGSLGIIYLCLWKFPTMMVAVPAFVPFAGTALGALIFATLPYKAASIAQRIQLVFFALSFSFLYGLLANFHFGSTRLLPENQMLINTALLGFMTLGGGLTTLLLYKLEPKELTALRKSATDTPSQIEGDEPAKPRTSSTKLPSQSDPLRPSPSNSATNLKGLLDTLSPEEELGSVSQKPTTTKQGLSASEVQAAMSGAAVSPTPAQTTPSTSPTESQNNLPEQKKAGASSTATRLQAQKRKSTSTFTKLQALSASGTGTRQKPTEPSSSGDSESDSLKSILDRLDTKTYEEAEEEAYPVSEEVAMDSLFSQESLLSPPEVPAEVAVPSNSKTFDKPQVSAKGNEQSPSLSSMLDSFDAPPKTAATSPVAKSSPASGTAGGAPATNKTTTPSSTPVKPSSGASSSGVKPPQPTPSVKPAQPIAQPAKPAISQPAKPALDAGAKAEAPKAEPSKTPESKSEPAKAEGLFETGIDKEIDDIFSNLVPAEAQKEVQSTGSVENETPTDEKAIEGATETESESYKFGVDEQKPADDYPYGVEAEAQESNEETKAKDGLFESGLDREIDDIFSNLVPAEAQKEVSKPQDKAADPKKEAAEAAAKKEAATAAAAKKEAADAAARKEAAAAAARKEAADAAARKEAAAAAARKEAADAAARKEAAAAATRKQAAEAANKQATDAATRKQAAEAAAARQEAADAAAARRAAEATAAKKEAAEAAAKKEAAEAAAKKEAAEAAAQKEAAEAAAQKEAAEAAAKKEAEADAKKEAESGLFAESSGLDKELDDIFSNLAPSEAQLSVTNETLAKVRAGDATGDHPAVTPESLAKTKEDEPLSFEPPAEDVELSREDKIKRELENMKPGKFNETLASLPSLQSTVEGLLNNLAASEGGLAPDTVKEDTQSFAPPEPPGETFEPPAKKQESNDGVATKVMDLLESLEAGEEEEERQEPAKLARESQAEESSASTESSRTGDSVDDLFAESIQSTQETEVEELSTEPVSEEAPKDEIGSEQDEVQEPVAEEQTPEAEETAEDSESEVPEESKEAEEPAAEIAEESKEGEKQEAEHEPSKDEMRSTGDVASALKDAQAKKHTEKELKEFGRLSSKQPASGPVSETAGTMKTIGKLLIEVQAVENIIKAGESGTIGSGLTTARVISAARGEGIKALLSKIDSYIGVAGSIIVGHDGLVIASTCGEGMDKDTLGVLSVACISTSNLATKKLEIGKLRQMVLITDAKTTVLTDVDVGILAVFLDNNDVGRVDGLLEAIHDTIHG